MIINSKYLQKIPFCARSKTGDVFFIGHRDGLGNVYWVDAKIIEELKPKELK